jgi:hypothetical protein
LVLSTYENWEKRGVLGSFFRGLLSWKIGRFCLLCGNACANIRFVNYLGKYQPFLETDPEFNPKRKLLPEEGLMIGVMLDAFHRGRSKEVLRWLNYGPSQYLFSFSFICSHFDWSEKRLRAAWLGLIKNGKIKTTKRA